MMITDCIIIIYLIAGNMLTKYDIRLMTHNAPNQNNFEDSSEYTVCKHEYGPAGRYSFNLLAVCVWQKTSLATFTLPVSD